MDEGVLFSAGAGAGSADVIAAFCDAGASFQVCYNVSEGMDVDTTSSTQRWNPFNGDVTAPATWFRLGFTRGMLCARGGAGDGTATAYACLFVFEYVLEHGLLLQAMANEMKATGLHVQGMFLSALEPHGVVFCGVGCGLKCCLTAIRFPWPAFPFPPSGPVLCCEMHAVLQRARDKTDGGAFQALLHSRDATSGHMNIKRLLTTAIDGKWGVFVQRWLQGDYASLMFLDSSSSFKKKTEKFRKKRLAML